MQDKKEVLSPDDYIQEGAQPASGVILLACTVGDDYDDPKNRVLVFKDNSWTDFTSAGEAILSIDCTADGQAYVLGENGTTIQFEWTAKSHETLRSSRKLIENEDVLRIGPLRRIRVISGTVFSAGSVGQLYELKGESFHALPKLHFASTELTIEDIAGVTAKQLFAVTSEGVGAMYDGLNWVNADLPTNVKLSSVCTWRDNEFVIAGSEGVVIVGQKGRWRILDPINDERTYWGVASEGERIYVAHLGGIDVIVDERLAPLEIPDAEHLEFTVLRNGPDGVWSFAGQTVGLVTADGWRTIISR